jgi:hypothetical protein
VEPGLGPKVPSLGGPQSNQSGHAMGYTIPCLSSVVPSLCPIVPGLDPAVPDLDPVVPGLSCSTLSGPHIPGLAPATYLFHLSTWSSRSRSCTKMSKIDNIYRSMYCTIRKCTYLRKNNVTFPI